jgi:hypothetical protein
MRPFACGLLAQMMSMFSVNSARPNFVNSAREGGYANRASVGGNHRRFL